MCWKIMNWVGTDQWESYMSFQIDMGDIKEKYQERYEVSLKEAVESDCGGDYKNMLLALLGE